MLQQREAHAGVPQLEYEVGTRWACLSFAKRRVRVGGERRDGLKGPPFWSMRCVGHVMRQERP